MKKKPAVWVRVTHLFRRDEYVCSVCGHKADKPHKSCPKCGTEIKKTVTDPEWINEMADFDEMFGE